MAGKSEQFGHKLQAEETEVDRLRDEIERLKTNVLGITRSGANNSSSITAIEQAVSLLGDTEDPGKSLSGSHLDLTDIGIFNHDDIDLSVYLQQDYIEDTHGPNGFVDRFDSKLEFDPLTRTLSISPVASSFSFWSNGQRFKHEIASTVVIDDLDGQWFFYFDDDGKLAATQTFEENLILRWALVSIVYWNVADAEDVYFADERHGCDISGTFHLRHHLTVGTDVESGLGIGSINADGNWDIDADAQISTTTGIFWDEDLRFEVSGLPAPANLPVYYLTGAGAIWAKEAARDFPNKQFPAGRLAYNEFALGSWGQSEVSNNDFVLSHIVATNGLRTEFAILQGQDVYTTRRKAREGALLEIQNLLTIGMPMAEYVVIGTIIFQTSDGGSNGCKAKIVSTDDGSDYVNWLEVSLTPGASPSSHLNLSDIGVFTHVEIDFLLGGLTDGSNADAYHVHATAGSGDVTGPASSVDNMIAVFNGTTGKLIRDSSVNVADIGFNTIHRGLTNNPHGVDLLDVGAAALIHNHLSTDITDFNNSVAANPTVALNTADRHAEVHTILSHDTTATGVNLNLLTGGANADSLHIHSLLAHTHNASEITAGTFATGNFVFDGNLTTNGFSYLRKNAYVNHSNYISTGRLYFHDGTSINGAYLQFDTSAQDFTLNKKLEVVGQVKAQSFYASGNGYFEDELYVNYNDGSVHSSIYFHNGASQAVDRLYLDQANGQFVFTKALAIGGDYVALDGPEFAIGANSANVDTYLYFGHSGALNSYLWFDYSQLLFRLTDDLQVNGDIQTELLFINYLNTLNQSAINFHNGVTPAGEQMYYDQVGQEFILTDDINIDGFSTATAHISDFIHLTKGALVDNCGGATNATRLIRWGAQLHIDTATFTHSTTKTQELITVGVTGRYEIKAAVGISQGGSGRTKWGLYVTNNGVDDRTFMGSDYSRGSSYGDGQINITGEVQMTAGHVLRIKTFVDDADGTYVSNTIAANCSVIVRRIG